MAYAAHRTSRDGQESWTSLLWMTRVGFRAVEAFIRKHIDPRNLKFPPSAKLEWLA
jgi:hypothetical protein